MSTPSAFSTGSTFLVIAVDNLASSTSLMHVEPLNQRAYSNYIPAMLEQQWPTYVLTALAIWISIIFARALQSPVSKVPGPAYSKFTEIWLMIQEFSGNRRLYIHELHQRYGPVVRLGPNEVSFTSLGAVKEIYTFGGSGYDKTE